MTNRIQVRCQFSNTLMHVQIIGKPNEGSPYHRKYGMATEYRIPQALNDWLVQQEAVNASPASGETLYIPTELYGYDDGTYQLLIKSSPEGTDPLNHPEGVMLNMKNESPAVAELITFCLTNELVTACVGMKPFKVEVEVTGEEE